LAFAVCGGFAVDAFVVRMPIVSAVMALLGRSAARPLGRSAWRLPRWLDRLLPNVDVEGEKLRSQFEPQLPEPEPELVSNRA
jgi:RND superfamily putative drug exporter